MTRRLATLLTCIAVLAAVPSVASGRTERTPDVTATRVADVTATTATVRANVNARGIVGTWAVEWGVTSAYGARTADALLVALNGNQDVAVALRGLAPGTTYRVRVVAANLAGTDAGSEVAFTTLPATAPSTEVAPQPAPQSGRETAREKDKDKERDGGETPAPAAATEVPNLLDGPVADATDAVVGTKVVVGAESGSVKVRVPGTDTYTQLGPGAAVPVGSVVDATRGTVRLTSAVGAGTQDALVGGAKFEVRQSRDGDGMTDLVLRGGDFSSCGAARAAAAGPSGTPRRSLWAKDQSGRFRTRGRHSVATVRGTEWRTTDTCRGTTTTVAEGAVAVASAATGRTVLVRAGRSFFMPAPRR